MQSLSCFYAFATHSPMINLADHLCSSVSFSQLQKQIVDLAATHFLHLPVRPPPEDLAQVPTNLPSFLGDTAASRYAYYGAHDFGPII